MEARRSWNVFAIYLALLQYAQAHPDWESV
jgi:hypothetical protein